MTYVEMSLPNKSKSLNYKKKKSNYVICKHFKQKIFKISPQNQENVKIVKRIFEINKFYSKS